jgi:hypothetical protein
MMKALVLIAALVLLVLFGCSGQPPYIGKWQRHVLSATDLAGTTEFLELSPNGKLVLRPPPLPEMADTGHFQVIDRGHLRVELYGVTGVCTASVHGNELRFTDPWGLTTVYQRSK